MDVYRAVVIRESLIGGQLPAGFPGAHVREYAHLLDEATPITIIEVEVDASVALQASMQLAKMLHPTKYYAHLVSEAEMYIAFPNCIVRVERDDEQAIRQAHAIGRTFDVPDEQMRFAEMFETDHPDAVFTVE